MPSGLSFCNIVHTISPTIYALIESLRVMAALWFSFGSGDTDSLRKVSQPSVYISAVLLLMQYENVLQILHTSLVVKAHC